MEVQDDSYQKARGVALAGVAVSGLLACSNIIIGLLTHSTSVVATGFEFAGDVFASSIVVVAMGVAARPADANHPYGHGRFETLSAFVVGVILSAAGVMIGFQSLQAVGARHAPPGLSAAGALVGAIVLRGIMSSLKFRVGRRLRSSALVADAWNDAVDILSACAALTAVGLAISDPARFLAADHYGGLWWGSWLSSLVSACYGTHRSSSSTRCPRLNLRPTLWRSRDPSQGSRGSTKYLHERQACNITSTCTSRSILR